METHKHTEIVGPFSAPEYSYAVIDGFKVPHIKLVRGTGQNDGKIEILLDGRMSYILDEDQIDVVLHLVANAMAVAAGYPCMGAENKMNPFHVRMAQIG